jgi:hypothetical protein
VSTPQAVVAASQQIYCSDLCAFCS